MGSEQASLGNCTNCGSPDTQYTEVRSAFWHEERLVVVDGIPAIVCLSCREQYYDDSTALVLDLMRGDGFPEDQAQAELRVPVFSFAERLAAKADI